jgi:hypothetical protein
MNTTELLSHIDAEIAGLREARALLAGQDGYRLTFAPKHGVARFMSPEARKRIGDAQRKRWAKQKAGKKAG